MVMKSAKDNVPIVCGITTPSRNHCKYEPAINPKTAKVLGLDVGSSHQCCLGDGTFGTGSPISAPSDRIHHRDVEIEC